LKNKKEYKTQVYKSLFGLFGNSALQPRGAILPAVRAAGFLK